jgi:20S proteasome subunit beta 5
VFAGSSICFSLFLSLFLCAQLKGQRFSVGSGATYAYGVLDSGFRHDLSISDAVELGKRSIFHATNRDAYSGGTINVYYIGPNGWVQQFAGDMNTLVPQFLTNTAVKRGARGQQKAEEEKAEEKKE